MGKASRYVLASSGWEYLKVGKIHALGTIHTIIAFQAISDEKELRISRRV